MLYFSLNKHRPCEVYDISIPPNEIEKQLTCQGEKEHKERIPTSNSREMNHAEAHTALGTRV